MRIQLIGDNEERYPRQMRETVLPALAQCREEGWMEPAEKPGLARLPRPVGDDAGSVGGAGGAHSEGAPTGSAGALHYVCYSAQQFDELGISDASAQFRGAVVISHGFTEFAAKYTEMVWYFLLAGFSVCVFEHRGHGYSPRDVDNPSSVWIDDWHRYVEDLAKFAQTVGVEAAGDQPLYLFAHSMGGAIGAAVMEQYPDLFYRAVLNAPGLEPNTGVPGWLARPVTGAAVALGLGRRRAPGQKNFDPAAPDKGHAQSAKARVDWYRGLRVADGHYQTNAATFGYTHEFLKMGAAAQKPEACARIETPILLFQAGRDVWVREGGEFRFVERVSDAGGTIELSRYDTSCHEIFSMPNPVLRRYLDEIFAFFVPDSPSGLTIGE